MDSSFRCIHCSIDVPINKQMGTSHRNHCPFCLWSKHVDDKTPGDRASVCESEMEPIGITLKHEGVDKYSGKRKYGDVMLIHRCSGCNKININRIASDDSIETIQDVYRKSNNLGKSVKDQIQKEGIMLMQEDQSDLIFERLFGKTS